MILVNPTKLLKLNLRSLHNYSGEHGDYMWKVINWCQNRNSPIYYDYDIEFRSKSNGKIKTDIFYATKNEKTLIERVNWIIENQAI